MNSPVDALFRSTIKQMARKATYSSETDQTVPGILINRDRPISSGFCGDDNCEHVTHEDRRRAQKAAETRAKK